jgi:curved DNA-binding protein CbpA
MTVKSWTTFNCYEVLEVPVGVSDEEIRAAFKHASRRAHPDLGGSHEAQVRVNIAYEVLSNAELRGKHDRHWKLGTSATGPIVPFFTGEEALRNLWTGVGGSSRKLADGKTSSGLVRRVKDRITRDRDRITLDRESRKSACVDEFTKKLLKARLEAAVILLAMGLAGLVGVLYPVAFLGTLGGGALLVPRLRGVNFGVGNELSVALLDPLAGRRIQELAERLSQESVARDRERLEVHFAALEQLGKLVTTSTKAADTENQVLRRLLATLFVLGLMPTRHDASAKRVVLQGEGEWAALFYQHGVNQPLALATVERILDARAAVGAQAAFLYNQGGLSEKAAECADSAYVRWVGIRELNAWAKQVWTSENGGPSGDILQRLAEFKSFLDTLPA